MLLPLVIAISVHGVLYALLIALLVFVVAYVVIVLMAKAGLGIPVWVAGALALIVFLLCLLGGVTAN